MQKLSKIHLSIFYDIVSRNSVDYDEIIKDDLWNNSMQYYLASEINDEEDEIERQKINAADNIRLYKTLSRYWVSEGKRCSDPVTSSIP